MNETISIVISAILVTLLIVLLPLVNILERQDNIAYNVVLTLTTNFIDDVRSKGFIDKELYYKYIEKIANTGNIYDISIEAHKKILFASDDSNSKFEEDTIIYNKHDVEKKLNDDGIYEFEIGDEFYIKIVNTNIPSSSIIYRFLAKTNEYKVININYGGVINKVNRALYEKSVKDYEHVPNISIGIPKNEANDTPGVSNIHGTYRYFFDLSENVNKSIKLKVILKNFNIFTISENKQILVNDLKDYIYIKGIDDYIIDILDESGNQLTNIETIDGQCTFYIKISGIRIDASYDTASVIILPDLGESDDEIISQGYESVKFSLLNDYAMYAMDYEGPFYENGNKVKVKQGQIVVYKRSFYDQKIFFNLKFTSINKTEYDILQAIEDKSYVYFDNIKHGPNLVTPFYLNDIQMTTYDDIYYFGIAKIPLIHNTDSSHLGYLGIEDNWIDAQDNGVDVPATGKTSNKYIVDIDNDAPTGELIVKDEKNKNALFNGIEHEVGTKKIHLDTKNISDEKSGLYKIKIKDNIETKEFYFSNDGSLSIPWDLMIPSGSVKVIEYILEDNVGNSVTKTLHVKYIEKIISDFWLTAEANRDGNRLETGKWLQQDKINIHIDTPATGTFSVNTQATLDSPPKQDDFSYTGDVSTNTQFDQPDWIPYGPAGSLASGIWTLKVQTNSVGIIDIKSKVYYIDNDQPLITVDNTQIKTVPDTPVYGYVKQYSIPAFFKDAHSGIADVSYVFTVNPLFPIDNDTEWISIHSLNKHSSDPYGEEANYNIKTDYNQTGTYYLHMKMYDSANNKFTQSYSKQYKIDNDGPIVTTNTINADGTTPIKITDTESGIKNYKYIILPQSENDLDWDDLIQGIDDGHETWGEVKNCANYESEINFSKLINANEYLWILAEDNLGNIQKTVLHIDSEAPKIDFKIGSEIGPNEVGILADITTSIGFDVKTSSYGWSDSEQEPSNWNNYEKDLNGNNIVGQNGDIRGSKFNIEETAENMDCYLYVKITDQSDNTTIEHIKINRIVPIISIHEDPEDLIYDGGGSGYWFAHYLADASYYNYTIPIGVKTNNDYELYSISIDDGNNILSYPWGGGAHNHDYAVNVAYGPLTAGVHVVNSFIITAVDRLGNTTTISTTKFTFYTMKIEYTYNVKSVYINNEEKNFHDGIATTARRNDIEKLVIEITKTVKGFPPYNMTVYNTLKKIDTYLEETIKITGKHTLIGQEDTQTYINSKRNVWTTDCVDSNGESSITHTINTPFVVPILGQHTFSLEVNSIWEEKYEDNEQIRTITLPKITLQIKTGQ